MTDQENPFLQWYYSENKGISEFKDLILENSEYLLHNAEKKIQANNADWLALFQLGAVFIAQGKHAEGLGILLEAEKLHDKSPSLYYLIGYSCYNLSNKEEALCYYQKCLAINDKYNIWFDVASLQSDLGKYEAAVASYKKHLEIYPQHNSALVNLGTILFFRLRDFIEALLVFERVLNVDGNSDSILDYAWYKKGIILHRLNRNQEALNSFENCLKHNKNNYEALFSAGTALLRLNRYKESLENFRKCLSINDQFEDAWNGKGNVLLELGRYEESLLSYEKCIALNEKYVHAWNGKGIVLYDLGRYKESLLSYEKCINIEGKYYYAWFGRGLTLEKLGNYKEALYSFHRYLFINKAPHEANSQALNTIVDKLGYSIPLLTFRIINSDRQLGYLQPINNKLNSSLYNGVRVIVQLVIMLDNVLEPLKLAPKERLDVEYIINIFLLSTYTDLKDQKSAQHAQELLPFLKVCQQLAYYLGDPIVAYRLADQWLDYISNTDFQVTYYAIQAAAQFDEAANIDLIKGALADIKNIKKGNDLTFYYAGLCAFIAGKTDLASSLFNKAPKLWPAALMTWYLSSDGGFEIAQKLIHGFPDEASQYLQGFKGFELANDLASATKQIAQFAYMEQCQDATMALWQVLQAHSAQYAVRPTYNKPLEELLLWDDWKLQNQQHELGKIRNRRLGDEWLVEIYARAVTPVHTEDFEKAKQLNEQYFDDLLTVLKNISEPEKSEQKAAQFLYEKYTYINNQGWLYLIVAIYEKSKLDDQLAAIEWEQVIRLWLYHSYLNALENKGRSVFNKSAIRFGGNAITLAFMSLLPTDLYFKLLSLAPSALVTEYLIKFLDDYMEEFNEEELKEQKQYSSFLKKLPFFIAELKGKKGDQVAELLDFMGVEKS